MSAKERREHLERAVAEGGVIMTARGTLTRQVPSGSSLARTPAEKRAARDDLERRMLEIQQEARRLEEDGSSEEEEQAEGGEGEESDDLESLTVAQLKERARDAGIEGYSQFNKADLIAAINEKA